MKYTSRLLVCLCCLSLATMAFAFGDAGRGMKKSSQCIACHGPDGNSITGAWPKLAGQQEKYLVKQLMDFKIGKDGGRYDPSMAPMVANLSEQDMEDLAAYFSQQTVKQGEALQSKFELGQAIYRGGVQATGVSACIACHGPRGLGNREAAYPMLSSQHPAYIEKQLRAYRDGTRKNDINKIMRETAQRMTIEEIQAVASYVSGLH